MLYYSNRLSRVLMKDKITVNLEPEHKDLLKKISEREAIPPAVFARSILVKRLKNIKRYDSGENSE